MVSQIKNEERRKKVFNAIQTAKDKNRAQSGRMRNESGLRQGSSIQSGKKPIAS